MRTLNLIPRVFPLKNGWEKPWGRGWRTLCKTSNSLRTVLFLNERGKL